MKSRFSYIIVFLLLGVFTFMYAKKSYIQQKKESENELNDIRKKLEEATQILLSSQQKEKATHSQLRALQHQTRTRQRLIDALENEIGIVKTEISGAEDLITGMQNDLDRLTKEYAEMIYQESKEQNTLGKLAFIFSAHSFHEIQMRIRYLEMYRESRFRQVQIINEVKSKFEEQENKLILHRNEKEQALNEIVKEQRALTLQKHRSLVLINQLKKDQKSQEKKIKEYKDAQERITKLIKELEKKQPGVVDPNSPEGKIISKSFADHRGKLPWPLEKCFVSQKYGTGNYGVNHEGVGLQTQSGAKVTSVFEGQVSMVAEVPGMHKVVMVRHGEFITVYAKLKSVSVKIGDALDARDEIGTIYTSADGETELEFQVWKKNETQNPTFWLAKK